MQTEIYNATNTAAYTSVSTTAKNALFTPQTKEAVSMVKTNLMSLVSQGKIAVKDNLHLLLNTPNPIASAAVNANGAAQPIVYHNLDSLNIQAKKMS